MLKKLFVIFTSFIVVSLVYFFISANVNKNLEDTFDINLKSDTVVINGNSFVIGDDSSKIINFIESNMYGMYADTGWQPYLEQVGICPSSEVRMVTFNNTDLVFMRQDADSMFAFWEMGQKSKQSLKGSTIVDNYFKIGSSSKMLEEKYGTSLSIESDDVIGLVFSIQNTNSNYATPSLQIDLPSVVPVMGNFNRSLNVGKVTAGFLCSN